MKNIKKIQFKLIKYSLNQQAVGRREVASPGVARAPTVQARPLRRQPLLDAPRGEAMAACTSPAPSGRLPPRTPSGRWSEKTAADPVSLVVSSEKTNRGNLHLRHRGRHYRGFNLRPGGSRSCDDEVYMAK